MEFVACLFDLQVGRTTSWSRSTTLVKQQVRIGILKTGQSEGTINKSNDLPLLAPVGLLLPIRRRSDTIVQSGD